MTDDNENENGNGSGRKISIKIDASMIMGLASILGVAGYGTYNQAASTDAKENMTTGVELHVNAARTETLGKVQKLSRLVKAQDAEIEELYEIIEWLIPALDDLGTKKHTALWNRLKRKAPDSVDFGDDTNGDGGHVETMSSRPPAPLPPEETEDAIYDDIEEAPEQLQFPAMDSIKAAVQRKLEGTNQ